jgi:predicted amidohydrolase
MTSLRICIAQTSPRSGSEQVPENDVFAVLESNLKTTTEVVKRVAAEGADLVVLPEYWLQGLVQDREVSVSSSAGGENDVG